VVIIIIIVVIIGLSTTAYRV